MHNSLLDTSVLVALITAGGAILCAVFTAVIGARKADVEALQVLVDQLQEEVATAKGERDASMDRMDRMDAKIMEFRTAIGSERDWSEALLTHVAALEGHINRRLPPPPPPRPTRPAPRGDH